MTGWSIHTKPIKEELFSSWLIRAAQCNGMDPMALTGVIWPNWRIWTIDRDRSSIKERLVDLKKRAGISKNDLTTCFMQPLLEHSNGTTEFSSKWLLPYGIRNRSVISGLQYCPECFKTDFSPYYRRYWRLAYYTRCEKHGLELRTHCPYCKMSLQPQFLNAQHQNLNSCHHCTESLSNTFNGEIDATLLDSVLTRPLLIGECVNEIIVGQDKYTLSSFLTSLRLIINIARRYHMQNDQRYRYIIDQYESPPPIRPKTMLPFECLPIHERRALLKLSGKILFEGLNKLISHLRKAGTTQTSLTALLPHSAAPLISEKFSKLPIGTSKTFRKTRIICPNRSRSKIRVLKDHALMIRRNKL